MVGGRLLQIAAEHEAGHAVVAAAFGLRLAELVVRSDGSGLCSVVTGAGVIPDVYPDAVRVAGDVWVLLLRDEPRPAEFSESSHTDTHWVRLHRSRAEVSAAQMTAYKILRARRAEVLALASRIWTDTTWAPARGYS